MSDRATKPLHTPSAANNAAGVADSDMVAVSSPPNKSKKASGKAPAKPVRLEEKFAKLGLRKDMDFVLHLPMRYEDETEVVSMRDAGFRGGSTVQVEGEITENEIQYRPRRQLVVTISDGTAQVVLRFLNFTAAKSNKWRWGSESELVVSYAMAFSAPRWSPQLQNGQRRRHYRPLYTGLSCRRRCFASDVAQGDPSSFTARRLA